MNDAINTKKILAENAKAAAELGSEISMSDLSMDNFPLDEQLIREYLLDNPNFFNRFPELLLAMRVSHNERGAVSLVERRQEILRTRVTQLEEEITSLMKIATENEKIFRFNRELSLKILKCEDLGQLRQTVSESLKQEFGFTHVRLITVHDIDSELANIWRQRIQQGYYFGRLTQAESKRLFGSEVGSVALTKLSDENGQVIFGVASADAAHFHPDMDHLFFEQIRDLIDHMLPKF